MNIFATDQQDLLFRCLRAEWTDGTIDALAQLTPAQWEAVAMVAEAQQAAPLFYHRCKRHQVGALLPPQVNARLHRHYYQTAVRNMLLWKELGEILDSWHQQGIAAIVLKGAALIGTVYQNKALRPMSDVDLLVPEAAVGRAVDLLLARGYQPQSQIGTEVADHFALLHHLPPFFHAELQIYIEVHTTIAPPNRFYSINIADLWAAAEPLSVAGKAALTLAAEDLLLYTCMHATYRHLFDLGVRFLCDIDAIVRHHSTALDWDRLVARARAWQWHKGAFLGLYLAQRLLATPIPAAALQALHPTAFREQGAREEIVAESLRLLFADQQATAAVDGEFAQKWHTLPWRAKIGKGLRMLTISRRQMATYYPSAPNSFKIFLYYPVRVKDLLLHNLPRLRLLWCKEPAIVGAIYRKRRLLHWLEKS